MVFKAVAPKVVTTGEQFQLKYSVNSKVKDFYPPQINDFTVTGGPSRSQSSNIQIINGQMTQNVDISFTYFLVGQKVGKFTIPPARVKIDNKELSSNAVTIEVIKGNAGSSQNQQTPNNTPQNNANQQNLNIAPEELFVRVILNKTSVYQGESVLATVKVFSKYNRIDLADMKVAPFKDFYKEELDPRNTLQRENINGQIYHTAETHKYVIYPQKSGQITIAPSEMEFEIVKHVGYRNRGWFFQEPVYKRINKKVSSQPVTLNVLPLPAGKPDDFIGAVGNFNLDVDIDKTDVEKNEAITLKLTFSGTGNIKLINAPKLKFPPDIESYEPKINTNVTTSYLGGSGNRVFEYLLIPRNAGKFRIPPMSFTYFDLTTKQYKSLTNDKILINVTRGQGDDDVKIVSGLNKQEIELLNSDIKFIKTGNIKLLSHKKPVYQRLEFYLAYAFIMSLFIVLILFARKRQKRNTDIQLVRYKKASKLAKKRLKNAHIALKNNNNDAFHEEVLKAIWGYLSDKLSMPVAELSKESAFDQLKKQNLDDDSLENLGEIISDCEFARYAPASDSSEMMNKYNEIVGLISEIEQNVK